MALRFDRRSGRFRDSGGRFVSAARGIRSSIARAQYWEAMYEYATVAPRPPAPKPIEAPHVADYGYPEVWFPPLETDEERSWVKEVFDDWDEDFDAYDKDTES